MIVSVYGESPLRRIEPPISIVRAMLDAFDLQYSAAPVTLSTSAWVTEQGSFYRMQIDCDQGRKSERSTRSWYQWQHPHWQWSTEPVPQVAL